MLLGLWQVYFPRPWCPSDVGDKRSSVLKPVDVFCWLSVHHDAVMISRIHSADLAFSGVCRQTCSLTILPQFVDLWHPSFLQVLNVFTPCCRFSFLGDVFQHSFPDMICFLTSLSFPLYSFLYLYFSLSNLVRLILLQSTLL